MAQPGEFFPQQFAQTILQLNAQRQQQQAQLEEMRSQRAASNFLEKERLALAQQGQALQFAQFGADRAAVEEAQKARVQMETERIKKEREGMAIKAFDDFARNGSAFLPNTAAGDISKFRDAYNRALGSTDAGPGYTVHEFEIPGAGTFLQRIGGPGLEQNALELEKTRQEIENLKQTRALQHAGQQLSEERAETERTKRLNLVGGVTARDAEFARSALESYRKIANNQIVTARDSGDLARAAALSLNWRSAFEKDQATASRVSNLEAIIDAFTESVRTGKVATQTNPEALKRAGVESTYFEAAGQALFQGPGERIVGRVSAPAVGDPGSSDDPRYQAGSFLITETGRRIPVSREEAERTVLGSVRREPSAAPPTAPAPAAAPTGPDPFADPANAAKAMSVLNDARAGKLPRNDPAVLQAVQFLREYSARRKAAQ